MHFGGWFVLGIVTECFLCREGRAMPNHEECTLPDYKMWIFAFAPKLRKLIWDLENCKLPYPCLLQLCYAAWRLGCSGSKYWTRDNETSFEHSHLVILFSLSDDILQAVEGWWKRDLVVAANPWRDLRQHFMLAYSLFLQCFPFWKSTLLYKALLLLF